MFSHEIDIAVDLKKKVQSSFPVDSIEVTDSIHFCEEIIKQKEPDMVFLHLNDELHILDFPAQFKHTASKFVLVSKDTKHILGAWRNGFYDFLKIPVTAKELEELKNRVFTPEQIDNEDNTELLEQQINEVLVNPKSFRKIVLSTDNSVYVIDISEILYCESMSGYTNFYLIDDTKILVTKTLKEYDTILQHFNFLRVHKSYLVNFEYITRFLNSDGGYVLIANKHKVPVSFRKKEALIKAISSNSINNMFQTNSDKNKSE